MSSTEEKCRKSKQKRSDATESEDQGDQIVDGDGRWDLGRRIESPTRDYPTLSPAHVSPTHCHFTSFTPKLSSSCIHANGHTVPTQSCRHNPSFLRSLTPSSTYDNIAEIRMKEDDGVRWKDPDE